MAGAGWTPHNLLVLQQHTTYMELEVEAGIVNKEAKDSFLDCIKEEVEANDGEANRIRKDAEESYCSRQGRGATRRPSPGSPYEKLWALAKAMAKVAKFREDMPRS